MKNFKPHYDTPTLRPAPLRPGDKIAIVAPASNVRKEALESGAWRLREMGYEPAYDPRICEQDLYFAGSAERRVHELHSAFTDPECRAIICARGGYGSNYLLPLLDLELVRQNPKIFVGYSDVTCLLTHLHDATGLITFHGPMVIKDFGAERGVHLPSWTAAVAAEAEWEALSPNLDIEPVASGQAEGELYGGCLSILVASLGTPYEARTEGKLLFLEDVNAKPYQVDRMLRQLKLAGKLKGVRGIIFGQMLDCLQTSDQGYTLQEVVRRVIGDLGIPVAYGLRSGHVSHENVTLPFGVRANLLVEESRVRLRILEPAVRAAGSQLSALTPAMPKLIADS